MNKYESKTFSYRYAEEILPHPKYSSVYDELMMVCQDCPLPVYPGKSDRQRNINVIQQLMNKYFLLKYKSLGWEDEPLAIPGDNDDALRSDFRKTFVDEETGEITVTVQIEVEFGNVASSYRNYFKFQLSFSYGLTNICVLVVPSKYLSVRIDSGVSNFGKTIREIPSANLSVIVSVWVIGLFDEEVERWDVKNIASGLINVEDGESESYKKKKELKLLKGDTRVVYSAHCEIVQGYIDSLGEI